MANNPTLKSMTGFGRNSADTQFGELLWEIRSVNHRYLEISLRIPDDLRALEPAIREALVQRLSRGKVDVSLKVRASTRAVAGLALNNEALSALASTIDQVSNVIPGAVPVDPLKVIQWPGILESSMGHQDEMAKLALGSLDGAINDLVDTREREGEKTRHMLSSRCSQIAEHIVHLRQHRPAVVEKQRAKLLAKLAELDIEHNEQRLEQELVFVAQRLDIDEELDRLAAHVSEFEKAMQRVGPIGRRLDFLMQEFNREANTIGSKAADLDTTGASVDIKVLIEQMREQVQNIE